MSAIKLPVRIEDGQFLVGADNELIAHLLSAEEAEMREIVALMNQGATKTVSVCTYCGSANIQQDAFVHYNDRENVQTFDELYCVNCGSSCKACEVTVPASFDVYFDLYTENK